MADDKSNIDPQRKEAFERLENKITILEDWIEGGIPFKLKDGNKQIDKNGKIILEFFPISISALKKWNGSKNSKEVVKENKIPKFQTSADVWKAAPKRITNRVENDGESESLFERLKIKAKFQSDNKNKSKIQELEELLAISQMNHKGLADELIQLRLDNIYLTEELHTSGNLNKSTKSNMKTQSKWKDDQLKQANNNLSQLKLENSQLKTLLAEHGISDDIKPIDPSIIHFPGNKDSDK